MVYHEPFGGETGDGWKDIIWSTHEKLKYIDPNYKIDQIKEKFGGLRYYFTPSGKIGYGSIAEAIMDDIVSMAEYKASKTCELCGAVSIDADVKMRNHHGWCFTYCKECADKVIAKSSIESLQDPGLE